MPPLETIAKACNELGIGDEIAGKIFDNYDRFLGVLDNKDKRAELEDASNHDDLRKSAAWGEIRGMSGGFHDGLVALFLAGNDDLKELTMKYGIF